MVVSGKKRVSMAGKMRRVSISLRVHPVILDVLRAEADRQGIGYQTLMHNVLRDYATRTEARRAS